MKKNSLIFCAVLISFTLMAFGYKNWNTDLETSKPATTCSAPEVDKHLAIACKSHTVPDLLYKVDTRFTTTISKEKLDQASSLLDILPERVTKIIKSYKNVEIATLLDDKSATILKGENEVFTPDQINLLQSTDYTSNFRIASVCLRKNKDTGKYEETCIVHYFTIVPEKEATFTNGSEALIQYLRENSKEKTAIITEEGLKPGRVSFTINKKAAVTEVKLNSTSGYPSVDETLVELIKNMPQKWQAARNAKGEKVDQAFTFFFGLEGC